MRWTRVDGNRTLKFKMLGVLVIGQDGFRIGRHCMEEANSGCDNSQVNEMKTMDDNVQPLGSGLLHVCDSPDLTHFRDSCSL